MTSKVTTQPKAQAELRACLAAVGEVECGVLASNIPRHGDEASTTARGKAAEQGVCDQASRDATFVQEGGGNRVAELSVAEFDAFLDDVAKTIDGDIEWREDEDHSVSVEFKQKLNQSSVGFDIYVHGSYNRAAKRVSFHIIIREIGRIYGLDHGQDHRNPDGLSVGEKHKHRWTHEHRDRWAYVPEDITADRDSPVDVWSQFCAEARIQHNGVLKAPPALQGTLW